MKQNPKIHCLVNSHYMKNNGHHKVLMVSEIEVVDLNGH